VPGTAAVSRPGRPIQEIPREAVAASRLGREGGRQRLLVRHGTSEIEMGKGLREPEREWLTQVLHTWAGQPEPAPGPSQVYAPPMPHPEKSLLPAIPALPAKTWIVVEQPEPDRLRLHWLPHPERKVRWGRGRPLRALMGISVGWLIALLVTGGIWLAEMGQLLSGGGGPVIAQASSAAFIGVFVTLLVLIGVGLGLGFWTVTQPERPESLTLTPGVLIHDPGHININGQVLTGKGSEIRRPLLGEVCLDRVLGRQRLTIDRGVERIEVGAGLREPEREWLARLLQAWAGPPG
jgi:hypothetical protein